MTKIVFIFSVASQHMIPISRYQMRKLKIVGIKVLERRSLDGDTNGKITLIGEGSITTVQRREG